MPAVCCRGLALLALAGSLLAATPRTDTARQPIPLVDLNRATIQQLTQLPGIGKSRAAQIVRYRQLRRFTRTTELLRIRGIGKRTFKKLRPLVTVKPKNTQLPDPPKTVFPQPDGR